MYLWWLQVCWAGNIDSWCHSFIRVSLSFLPATWKHLLKIPLLLKYSFGHYDSADPLSVVRISVNVCIVMWKVYTCEKEKNVCMNEQFFKAMDFLFAHIYVQFFTFFALNFPLNHFLQP